MSYSRVRSLPLPIARRRLPVLMAAALLMLSASPGARTDEPPVFAVTNARIVTVTGAPIEKGSVLIRNSIIEAVGADIAVPADARIIDGTGMTVYPGLIDALSDVGLDAAQGSASTSIQAVRTPGAQRETGAAAPAGPLLEERQGLTPYRQAVESINAANRKIESARAAGITTALVAPRGGIFPGQSTLINLTGNNVGAMVVKTPVAYHINLSSSGSGFGAFGRSYPGSLMGILAFVKQTLIDADGYAGAWKIYAANPGAERPAYSRALEALQPVVQKQSRVVLTADGPVEIQRVLDLADSYHLDLILAGASNAAGIAPVLKNRKVPVLLSVKYPEKERDADPEAREELKALRRRVQAPSNAAALAKAGVSFAFQSGDTANPRDFVRNVGKAVEAGLDRETALRSLTITAAEILGVSDRLGSIEKNKTANLIVTTGDIFDPRTRVKFAFVDGNRYEIAEQAEPSRSQDGGEGSAAPGSLRPPSAPPASSTGAAGIWIMTVRSPQGDLQIKLDLQQSGSTVTGNVTSPMGNAPIEEGNFSGSALIFKINAGGMSVSFSGTIQGDRISGTMSAGAMGSMECNGTRTPGASLAGREVDHEIE